MARLSKRGIARRRFSGRSDGAIGVMAHWADALNPKAGRGAAIAIEGWGRRRSNGATQRAMNQTWQELPAIQNTCHNSCVLNTPGTNMGQPAKFRIAPIV